MDTNKPESLAESIDIILSLTKEEYERMSLNGRKLVDENFITESQIYKWIDLYENILKES